MTGDESNRLTRRVAHDLGNLLGIINAHCEVLARSSRDEAGARSVDAIHDAAARARVLTQRLFDLCPERGDLSPALDLNEAIAALANTFGGRAKIALVPRLDPAGCPVRIGREQADQVLLNLVMNGIDSMPNGGTLTVETSNAKLGDRLEGQPVAPGNYVMLSVSDTGRGIESDAGHPAQEASRSFLSAKQAGRETELGLVTIQWIVAQDHGYALVTTLPKGGTTLTVYLPSP